jgi:hypothetical protein
MALTVKIGITGQTKFIKLTIEIITGAATARATAPVEVVIICERSTIIYNTTERRITNIKKTYYKPRICYSLNDSSHKYEEALCPASKMFQQLQF